MNNVWRVYAKVFPFGIGLVIWTFFATGAHEQLHMVTDKIQGFSGYVTFNFWSGMYVHIDPTTGIPHDMTWSQDFITGLMGGVGVALILGIYWLVEHWQAHYSKWELDNVFIAGIMVTSQFIYGIADGLDTGEQTWGTIGGILAAFVVCTLLYGKRVWKWVNEEE